MSRVIERIARAGRGVEPGWDDDDVDRVWRGLVRKRRQRVVRVASLGATVGIVAGIAALSTVVTVKQRHREAPALVQTLRFDDGSQAVAAGAGSAMTVAEDSASHVTVSLARGGARFDVVHRTDRIFSVRAGDVTITVLGTAFTVERVADRVGVTVTRGAVSVDWRSGMRQLRAGQEGWFPPLVVAPTAVDERPQDAVVVARPRHLAPAGEPRSSTRAQRSLASAARSIGSDRPGVGADEALAAPLASPPPTPLAPVTEAGPRALPPAATPLVPAAPPTGASVTQRPPVDDPVDHDAQTLLTAADNARLAGHPEEGATLLRRLMRDHPADPRAPLAAFSLGRLLLGDLDRPLEAARAFARARALEPRGPLAEDALAREAEAWSRAGDGSRARACAEEYLRLYPQGRRVQDVRSFGGR